MEVSEIMVKLKETLGDKFDEEKVKGILKGFDHSKMNFSEILNKVKTANLVGDLDGDGKEEGLFEELKGKAASIFGKFGK